MATAARALGRLFDIGTGITPVNLNTGANTGKRIWMGDCQGIAIVIFCGVGTAGSDLPFTLRQSTAYTSGTVADFATVTRYYMKDELALDNDESWVEVTQAVAAGSTDAGGLGTSAEHEQIVVIEVTSDSLSDGYTHLQLNIAQPGATKLGAVLYVKYGLKAQRRPAALPNLLNRWGRERMSVTCAGCAHYPVDHLRGACSRRSIVYDAALGHTVMGRCACAEYRLAEEPVTIRKTVSRTNQRA